MQGVHTADAFIDNGVFGTHTIRFETGRLARLANGSAVVYLDDETMVLSATTASKQPKEGLDFFPLTVDVEERMYAAGRIPGSFFRREGRPSEDAILTCRLIDRPLRPSFVKGLRNEIQIVETIMALHPEHLYDVVAINAASLSTQLAGLPFSGPIGGVRVALIKGQWVAFPTHTQLEEATFDMVVAGRVLEDGDVAIMMVEAESTPRTLALLADAGSGAVGPTEETVAEGLEAAKPFIKVLCEAQQRVAAQAAKETADYPIFAEYGQDVYDALSAAISDELAKALTIAGKHNRETETGRRAHRRPRPGRHPPAVRGGARAAPGARVGAVRARRDADTRRHDAEHAPDGADDRHAQPRADQAVHAQLQHAALFDRGDRAGRLAEAAGDRPWRARRAGADPGAADAGGIPVRDPAGVGGDRLQRLHLHGFGLRLHHVAS